MNDGDDGDDTRGLCATKKHLNVRIVKRIDRKINFGLLSLQLSNPTTTGVALHFFQNNLFQNNLDKLAKVNQSAVVHVRQAKYGLGERRDRLAKPSKDFLRRQLPTAVVIGVL